MAGAGYKTFVNGDVLDAGEVNTYLMQQSVMVFANSTARDTALPSPSEGMVCYLSNINTLVVYNGSAWIAVADADVLTFTSNQAYLAGDLTIDTGLVVRNYGSNILQIENANGELRIGPNSTSFCHFYTDRPSFYFDSPVMPVYLHAYNDGTISAPAIAFRTDTNTGIYRFGADSLGITSGGVNAIVTSSAGTIGTAQASTATTSGYQYVLRDNTFGFLYRYTSKGALKENIATLGESGAAIDALRPVSFTAKFVPQYEGHEDTPEAQAFREADVQYGFIAEEVAAVDERLAQWEANGDELVPAGWRWEHMIALLTKEVQDLRARVAQLEASN